MSQLHYKVLSGAMRLAALVIGFGQRKPVGYEHAEVSQAYRFWFQKGELCMPVIFLDVRSPGEFAKAHIAGAILIPIKMLTSRLHEIPQNTGIYVYCHSGGRSAKASAILAKAGYSNIINVQGGIVAWQNSGYPTESLAPVATS